MRSLLQNEFENWAILGYFERVLSKFGPLSWKLSLKTTNNLLRHRSERLVCHILNLVGVGNFFDYGLQKKLKSSSLMMHCQILLLDPGQYLAKLPIFCWGILKSRQCSECYIFVATGTLKFGVLLAA